LTQIGHNLESQGPFWKGPGLNSFKSKSASAELKFSLASVCKIRKKYSATINCRIAMHKRKEKENYILKEKKSLVGLNAKCMSNQPIV